MDQLSLGGTATRKRPGYQRNAVERRLRDMAAAGRKVDTARASVLRDLADTIDRERRRLADTPDASGATLGRLLAELASLWDAWDPPEGVTGRDPWDALAEHLADTPVGNTAHP